jgi:hypothetical protein
MNEKSSPDKHSDCPKFVARSEVLRVFSSDGAFDLTEDGAVEFTGDRERERELDDVAGEESAESAATICLVICSSAGTAY